MLGLRRKFSKRGKEGNSEPAAVVSTADSGNRLDVQKAEIKASIGHVNVLLENYYLYFTDDQISELKKDKKTLEETYTRKLIGLYAPKTMALTIKVDKIYDRVTSR